MSDEFGFFSAADVQRRADRADVLADRARLRARLQGDRRGQLRPGRVRHDRGLRGGGRPHGAGARRCGWPSCVALVGHGRASASPSSASCCASSSAGPSSPWSWPPSAWPRSCAASGRSRIFPGTKPLPLPHPRRAVHPRAAVHPAHPARGRRREPGLPRRLRLVLPEVAQGHRHARGGRQPAGRHGHGHQRRALLRRGVGDDRHRVGARRHPLGQPARRRREPGAGRLQGVPGGDPGRARLDPGRHRRRPHRRHRRERRRRLHRSLRRRRHQGLRALRADDHGADDPPLRHLRQEESSSAYDIPTRDRPSGPSALQRVAGECPPSGSRRYIPATDGAGPAPSVAGECPRRCRTEGTSPTAPLERGRPLGDRRTSA